MIIQCSRCSAKFRFDDALMREEGVWVCCGRCRYEFFQGHPLGSPVAPQAEESHIERSPIGRKEDRPDTQPEDGVDAEPVINIKDDIEDMEDVAASEERPARGRLRVLAYLLALLLILAGAGFLAFPDLAQQTISKWSAYLP